MTKLVYKTYLNDTTAGGFTEVLNPLPLTTAQRDALSLTTTDTLVIFNTTTKKINFWNGTTWEAVTSA